MGDPTPIRLGQTDAARYGRLRRAMLEDAPWAFAAEPEDDEALGLFAAGEDSATFAIVGPGGDLVAAASVTRARPRKFRHRARIWGVFVDPVHRSRGLGRATLVAALDLARSWPGLDFVDLGVSARSPEARRLYERLGFVVWGREPEATDHAGARHDELQMTLKLRRS